MEAAVNQLLFCPPRQMIWNKGLGEGGDGGKGSQCFLESVNWFSLTKFFDIIILHLFKTSRPKL